MGWGGLYKTILLICSGEPKGAWKFLPGNPQALGSAWKFLPDNPQEHLGAWKKLPRD
ncbi:hypothetical protein T230_15000 [Tannerella sp. oral taxon BU063 isolate Cell 1/3]|uniref:Uncharacterized protein n=1 Tax=Tannerella sp. oral taxon BU063 isolate Cell 1/3 TaxID=1411022 RepID=W2CFP9_9BACT|nr:hypothetical protein T230_15000 [Tannerella sp. oral taxon BU063 isolate Cell 1/3]